MQSRQNVQSMLLDFRGWNRCSSHPGMSSLPRMQSLVWHEAHTTGVAHLDFQR